MDSLRLFLHQLEAVVVCAVVELAAAIVAGDGAADGFDAVDGGEAMRAEVAVVALHTAAFEGQRVVGLLAADTEIRAGGLPLRAVGFDAAATASFVGDEVGEFVFERAPEFFGRALAEFRVEFDRAVRPPCTAGGGLHARVPGDAHLAGEFRQEEVGRGFRAPRGEPAILSNSFDADRGRGLENPQPRGPSEFELRQSAAHCVER